MSASPSQTATDSVLPPPAGWGEAVQSGLLVYYLTSLIAVLGVLFGNEFLKLAANPLAVQGDTWAAFANWDGRWYKAIAEEGYTWNPRAPSRVAFFPAYPLLGRLVAWCTGCRTEIALLAVTHASLALAFILNSARLLPAVTKR